MLQKRNTKRFCSSSCRQQAFYKRHFSVRNANPDLGKISIRNDINANETAQTNNRKDLKKANSGDKIDVPNANLRFKAGFELFTHLLSILQRVIHLSFQPNVFEADVRDVFRALESFLGSSVSKRSIIDPAWLNDLESLQMALCRFSLRNLDSEFKFCIEAGLKGRLIGILNVIEGMFK